MDLYQGRHQPFHRQFAQEIKEVSLIVILLGFLSAYHYIPIVQSLVDKPFNFAVAGITMAYGHVSTFLYEHTGMDFGFVSPRPDPDFLFRVRLAAYVNEKRPGPLLDIAVDARLTDAERTEALNSLLKFDSTAQWVQPLLNELAKGGLPGLYEKQSPLLDALMQRVRAEGGIRQPLVRAYADSVLSFIMQHPKPVLREHAYRWVNDLIAEDSIYLLADRLALEKDPEAREALSEAFWNIRAVSNPSIVPPQLLPSYRVPGWNSVRTPLAYVLARTGYSKANEALMAATHDESLGSEKLAWIHLALSGKPFPKSLSISDQLQTVLAQRKKAREDQVRWAVARQMMKQQAEENERLAAVQAQQEAEAAQQAEARRKAALLAQAKLDQQRKEKIRLAEEQKAEQDRLREEKAAQSRIAAAKLAQEKAQAEKIRLEQKRAADAKLAEAKKQERARQIAAAKEAAEKERLEKARIEEARLEEEQRKKQEQEIAAAKAAEEKARIEKARLEEERMAAAKKAAEEKARLEKLRIEEEKLAAAKATEENIDTGNFNPDAVAVAVPKQKEKVDLSQSLAPAENPELAAPEKSRDIKSLEATAKKPVDLITVQVKGAAPTTPAAAKLGSFEKLESKIAEPTKVAKMPTEAEINQELARREQAATKKKQAKAQQGQMSSVNLVFAVKNQDVPLYVNPGYTKLTGVVLPIGSKGQASFRVMIGDDEWFQVKCKKDTGWANASLLNVYEVPTVAESIPLAAPVDAPKAKPKAVGQAMETTYFEPVSGNVAVFSEPADNSNVVGSLEEGVAYQATKSQKIGTERWFLLQLNSSKSGWVHGVDVQLAGEILPPPEEPTDQPLQPGEKWVAATDDGVPVYNKPSIAGKKVKTIAPGDSYKVTEVDEGSGNEWYKIAIGNREGWVQSMFVKVIKEGKKSGKKS